MVRRWRKDQANLLNGELKMSAKRKTMGCYTPKYPELDQILMEWFSEQRSQGKFFILTQNQLILSDPWIDLIFDRVAMFTKAVGTTACDWSVSDVIKTSQSNDLKISPLLFSLTEIAVSGLILWLKAKELCSDLEFKASLGWYQNWKKRHAISFRTKTTLAQ